MTGSQIDTLKKVQALLREHFGHAVVIVPDEEDNSMAYVSIGHPLFTFGLLLGAAKAATSGGPRVVDDSDDEPDIG